MFTCRSFCCLFFFFNDTATTEIYTLSLHDALPILCHRRARSAGRCADDRMETVRSEEHTSELQSPKDLVCRLLLEKKKTNTRRNTPTNTHRHGSDVPLVTKVR